VTPTEEQIIAIDLFRAGGNLKINAYAGTGKTTTLAMLAAAVRRKGIYLAFNRAIAQDAAARFNGNVQCSTIHSLAFRSTPSSYKHGDKMTGWMNANALAEKLNLKPWVIENTVKLRPRSQAFLVLETLRKFLHSPDPEPQPIDLASYGKLALVSPEALAEVGRVTIERTAAVWKAMITPRDPHPLGHDGYLKRWALSRPEIAADFILLDEAQDTNPVMIDVLLAQDAQLVCVGDRYQQIYEWRGAVNAMQSIDTPHEAYLTKSFRFGSVIADAASRVLRALGEQRPMRGNPAVQSRLSAPDPDAILARTNAVVLSEVMAALERDVVPHILGGTNDLKRLIGGVYDLKAGRPTDVREFFGFTSWAEVVEFVESGEGEHLRTFVSLIDRYGEAKLYWAIRQVADSPDGAKLTISTAHKAKGREWRSVRLADDFLKSKPSSNGQAPAELDPSEVRVFYVALTRGREEVEVSPATLALFDGAVVASEALAPQPVSPQPRVSRPAPVVPAAPPGNGAGVHPPAQDRERIVPTGRVNADEAFRELAKALLAFTRARERGETVNYVRIDPVIAAWLVESWVRYQKAGGKLTFDQVMQIGQPTDR
jgi:superfamily I DNA/RNA helicase